MLGSSSQGTGSSNVGLHLLGGFRVSVPGGQLQTMLKQHSTTSTSDTLKEWSKWALEPCWIKSCFEGSAPAQLIFHGCQSQYSQLISLGINPSYQGVNSTQGSTTTGRCTPFTQRHTWSTAQLVGKAMPLDPTGHLLHKAILPKPGEVVALINT